jgi:hypothetical protein
MEISRQSPALFMRILKFSFIVSALLFVYIAIEIPIPPRAPISLPVEIAITVVGLACVFFGFFAPRFIFRDRGRGSPDKPASAQLNRWAARGLLSLAYFEACVLFGLVLHYLEASERPVEVLFAAGIIAMVSWSPGAPPGAEEGNAPRG